MDQSNNKEPIDENGKSANLNIMEQQLRIHELKLKIAALEKPEYRKVGTWTGIVAILVAITGIIAQGILYEIKSARAQEEARNKLELAMAKRDSAELHTATLTKIADSLQQEVDSLGRAREQSLQTLEELTDKIGLATRESASILELGKLQQDANAAAIDLRASSSASPTNTGPVKSLRTVIEQLFAAKASTRGAAYNQIMVYHSKRPELVPSLLEYANQNINNKNGIYNTLVVLEHLETNRISSDVFDSIRSFLEVARNNGPKTEELVNKLLPRFQ